jgi:hypothetical protein
MPDNYEQAKGGKPRVVSGEQRTMAVVERSNANRDAHGNPLRFAIRCSDGAHLDELAPGRRISGSWMLAYECEGGPVVLFPVERGESTLVDFERARVLKRSAENAYPGVAFCIEAAA